jgi:tripartite-type tricarboxylate transporter receptor subunit TctC
MVISRRHVMTFGLGAVWPFPASRGLAQALPQGPLRWLVGFPPGGGATIATRVMADWLSRRLGQPVLVENRPGASGNLALQEGSKSAPDGQTVLLIPASAVVNRTVLPRRVVDVLSDVEPVSGLVNFALVLLVSPAVQARRVDELIAYAKAHPGELNLASFGVGSTSHLAGELFQQMTDTRLTHVPYPGEAAALTDLLGGHVHVMFGVLTTSLPYIKAGSVKAVGVATQDRHPLLPDLPAVGETISGFEASSWLGVGLPKGAAREVVAVLNRHINTGLADLDIRARYQQIAATPLVFSPEEFGLHMSREADKWATVVRQVGLSPR